MTSAENDRSLTVTARNAPAKKAFRLNGGHTPGARGGNRLTVRPVLNVARVKDSGDVSSRPTFRNNVAIRIEVDLPGERLGVGNVADGQKEAADLLVPNSIRDHIAQLDSCHGFRAYVVDVLHYGVEQKLDFRIRSRPLQHDLGGAEPVAAVHQGDLGAEAGEERGFFHGRIAAADHHDLAVAVKRSVASGAGADAVPDELLFVGKAQPARGRAGSDDQGFGLMPLAVYVQPERALG